MYNIVLSDNKSMIMASCPTYEIAIERLKDILKIDKELAKYYGWTELPKYEIVKGE